MPERFLHFDKGDMIIIGICIVALIVIYIRKMGKKQPSHEIKQRSAEHSEKNSVLPSFEEQKASLPKGESEKITK